MLFFFDLISLGFLNLIDFKFDIFYNGFYNEVRWYIIIMKEFI